MRSVSQYNTKEIISIRPKIFADILSVRAGMSTKLGEVQSLQFNKKLDSRTDDQSISAENNLVGFFSQLGISECKLAMSHQCHSNNVRRVETAGTYKACDALVTNIEGLALAISIADCVPILLYDPKKKAISAVHAGWRGSVGIIAQRAIEKLMIEYQCKPEDILAFIGPAAGVCCYEVGEEVAFMFRDETVVRKSKKIFIDLKKENEIQLRQCGILKTNIEMSEYCTICGNMLFHSYRRDGLKAGRMIAVIYMISS